MIENFEEKKQELINRLELEYLPKSGRWWQQKKPNYTLTSDVASSSKINTVPITNIVIKNERSNAVIPMLFLIGVVIGMRFMIKNDGILWAPLIFFIIFSIAMLFIIYQSLSGKEKLNINSKSIIVNKKEILWKNIVASYIKEDSLDESVSFDLIIYYYDSVINDFDKIECYLNNLDLSKEDICFYLEYWKEKNKIK